jgi:amidase
MDAALLLTALAGADAEDPVTAESAGVAGVDYAAALKADALAGQRIGVIGGTPPGGSGPVHEAMLAAFRAAGAELVSVELQQGNLPPNILTEEFERDLNTYLASLPAEAPMRSLADIIAFNQAHAAEGAIKFGQTQLAASAAVDLSDAATLARYEANRRDGLAQSRARIDEALAKDDLGALLFAGNGSAGIGARAAYPSVAVPIGYNADNGRPVGVTLLGGAYTEAKLLSYAYAYEQAAKVWQPPSVKNPSLFRGVRIPEPEEGMGFLPAVRTE